MAKLILPAYIESIHGRAGDTIFYTVAGRQYARAFTHPRNPGTEVQQKNRAAFSEGVKGCMLQGTSVSASVPFDCVTMYCQESARGGNSPPEKASWYATLQSLVTMLNAPTGALILTAECSAQSR